MKVIDKIRSEKISFSFEVFPPKTEDKFEAIQVATEQVAALSPDFMSVTYGAGGGTSKFTVKIASDIQKKFNIPVLAHLSCISSTKEGVRHQLEAIREAGIENVLALRGDIPQGAVNAGDWDYHYASELVREIKEFDPGICIGGACYPECHPESKSQREDILNMKKKVDAGCEFLTTQMFFDNNVYWNYLYKVRDAGINVPIVAGIMPITSVKQVERSLKLSGAQVPLKFKYMVDRFGHDAEAMRQAGIIYATEQIVDLIANGVSAVHLYTMNNAYVAESIKNNLKGILEI
ncbi:MAG: methylenetetrahydrofolate reductase [Lachnospiraceae bacterium]|nr:methylenetetrahydrofolate reductase [NAD(P)H] [Lachnospiraceae bacterium]